MKLLLRRTLVRSVFYSAWCSQLRRLKSDDKNYSNLNGASQAKHHSSNAGENKKSTLKKYNLLKHNFFFLEEFNYGRKKTI